MTSLIEKLHLILNEIKGIVTGYTLRVTDAMIINYHGTYYRINFTKVKPIEVTNELRKEYFCFKYNKEEDEMIVMNELLRQLADDTLEVVE